MLALIEPGDEVIYPDPGFPIYESMIRFSGGVPVPIPLIEERGFSFDLDLLRKRLSPKTKMLVLNSPQNPDRRHDPARRDSRHRRSGARPRSDGALRRDLLAHLLRRRAAGSIASLPGMLEKTIILDGFSKTYAMTGWRMGYGVMPEWLVEAGQQADGQLEFLHRQLHAARRNRRARWPAAGR